MRIRPGVTLVLACLLVAFRVGAAEIEPPAVILTGVPFNVSATVDAPGEYLLDAGGTRQSVRASAAGAISFTGTIEETGVIELQLQRDGQTLVSGESRVIAGWLAIVPPFLAIAIALLFHSVIPALFLGAWVGVLAAMGF